MCFLAFIAASRWMRPEARRRREDDEVDAGVEHLLVGVEPVERGLRRDLDLVLVLPVVALRAVRLERPHGPSACALEHVADGDDLDLRADPLMRVSASRMSRTAPVPRPPQPISPTLIVSLPAANAPAGGEAGGDARGGRGLQEITTR